MRCTKAHRLIHEQVDRALGQDLSRVLEAHLDCCESCRALHHDLIMLKQQAEHMEMVQPAPHLWPDIKQKLIQTDNSHKRLRFTFVIPANWKWVAAAMSLVVAAIGFTVLHSGGISFLNRDNANPAALASEQLRQAEAHYQMAISSMSRALPDQLDNLPDELKEVLSENLGIIDDAIRVCQAAANAYPDNMDVQYRLVICYRKKIELLNEIRKLALQAG